MKIHVSLSVKLKTFNFKTKRMKIHVSLSVKLKCHC